MFAQENKAKKYSKDTAKLFKEVKYMNESMQFEIHYVMTKLIRLHFREDENKTRELLTMITKAVHPDALDDLTTLEKMANEISQKDEALSQKDDEISRLRNKLKENNIEVD